MIVKDLIEMLKEVDPLADVVASDVYGEGQFPITGMIYNKDEINLTGERDE